MIGNIADRGLHDKGENTAYGSNETHLSQCKGKLAGKGRKQRADERIVEVSCEVDQEEKKNHLNVNVS